MPAAAGKDISLTGLDSVSTELLEQAGSRSIWLLFGEMGSGKTTLVKSIGKQLGVSETMSSPTFSLVNEYPASGGRRIYHVDLYRLKTEREVVEIGLEEYFNSGQLCLVEWPDRLGRLTPSEHFKVKITPADDLHRKIEFQQT